MHVIPRSTDGRRLRLPLRADEGAVCLGSFRRGSAESGGYAPGKLSPDGTLAPLSSHELRLEAMRFRRGANRARQRSDFANAARLDAAADEFQRKADELAK